MVRILASYIEFASGYRSVKLPLESFPQEERQTVIMAIRDMQQQIDTLTNTYNRMKHGTFLR